MDYSSLYTHTHTQVSAAGSDVRAAVVEAAADGADQSVNKEN